MALPTAAPLRRHQWRVDQGVEDGVRAVPEETPIAIVHDGSTTAVMMATPADLEDFGIGFSLSEGIIASTDDIRDLQVVPGELGVEVRLWLAADRSQQLAARRRRLVGPTGCGLCGVDSLSEAVRSPVKIDADCRVSAAELLIAMSTMERAQPLAASTRAVHAAGLWNATTGLGPVREDVGRHNALDKLIGAARRDGIGRGEVLLLTSRVSVEMVQKAAVLGAPILCAISAPTALAVRTAEAANLTLVGVARTDGLEVFTHAGRISFI